MDVRLKVLKGSNSGKEVRVPQPQALIGRSEECHLRPQSEAVGRRHCVLLVRESKVIIQDLGSRNGTFVNGERISKETALSSGDVLGIGPLEFEIIIESLERLPSSNTVSQTNYDEVSAWLHDVDVVSSNRHLRHDRNDVSQLFQPSESRNRVVIGSDLDVSTVTQMLRDRLRATQLVFGVISDSHRFNADLTNTDSLAVRAFSKDFTTVIVLDARNGVQPDGGFSIEAFCQSAFDALKSQLGVELDGNHHEQELVQILRDVPQLLLCVSHFHLIPESLFSRVRCLIQEGYSSLVCYQSQSASLALPKVSYLAEYDRATSRELERGVEESTYEEPNHSEIGRASGSSSDAAAPLDSQIKKELGKLPPRIGKPAEGSPESAAEVLKKFFRRG